MAEQPTGGERPKAAAKAAKAKQQTGARVAPKKPRARADAPAEQQPRLSLKLAEYEQIAEARLEHLVPVTQPFVLITQVPRSGGTLLMRLFDGHSSCHTIPHEWPGRFSSEANLVRGSKRAWNVFRFEKLARHFDEGFKQPKVTDDDARHPFVLPPGLHQQLFYRLYAGIEARSARSVANAYMTAYFNAWLDNRSLRLGEKQWVVGFTPRLIVSEGKLQHFDAAYPDGIVVTILRDPRSWWVSARKWGDEWQDRDAAMERWCENARAALKRQHERPDNTLLLSFDDLVLNTRATMTMVAKRLGIPFEPTLTQPTFNGSPVKPNSSFPWGDASVSAAPTRRGETELTAEDLAAIAEKAGPLYEKALRNCSRPAAARKRADSPRGEG